MTEIISTHEMAEAEWDGRSEPQDVDTNMVATKEAEGRGIEFHVSMRSYTQRDMEALIVEAAARCVVGNYGQNELAKKVQERCIELVTAKADAHLAKVSADIIDQPIIPKYPFQKPDERPMTMREFIGLTGRDYLNARVDILGKPTTDRSYSKSRLQYLVETAMQTTFKREIEKTTNAAISEVQSAIRAQYDALIVSEKKRLRDALAKLTGGSDA